MHAARQAGFAACATAVAAVLAVSGLAAVATTERASVSSSGGQSDGRSSEVVSLSGSGRFVAFESLATNLVAGDTNGVSDVFVRDRVGHRTTRVSVSSNGDEGNGPSGDTALARNGNFVAFTSEASNLVLGDTNGRQDVFVRARDMDRDRIFDEPGGVKTIRVTVATDGGQADEFSFDSGSFSPVISGAGRFVAFVSDASDLVAGDTNGNFDIFVRDRDADADGNYDEPSAVRTTRVSVSPSGQQANGLSWAPAISRSGRFVAFRSSASNLVPGDDGGDDVFVRDRDADRDGRFDEVGASKTVRVSVSTGGEAGNGASGEPLAISESGRFVAFASWASNLVAGDTNDLPDLFVHDRDLDGDRIFDEPGAVKTVRVSASSGVEGANALGIAMSGSARFIVFTSDATNLVPGDLNRKIDVFMRDRDVDGDGIFDEPSAVRTFRVSIGPDGRGGNGDSFAPGISADGRVAGFSSSATNLVPGDTNDVEDVFARAPVR